MELAQLIANAPWREAVTHRETWPHEYVLTSKDGQQELLAAARFRTYQIVTGNPDTVIKKLKHVIDIVDSSYLVLWGREGRCPMTRRCGALTCWGRRLYRRLRSMSRSGGGRGC